MSITAQISTTTAPYADLPQICIRLHEAKARKGVSFADLGKAIGRDEVWVAAVFYAQAKPEPEDLKKLAEALEIGGTELSDSLGPHWWPQRGLGNVPPSDPVIYRLFEGVLVYGQAIKAVIHEKFGDGIMSMIDCRVHVEKKPDPKGDRVILTFDGKFLPYIRW